MTVGMAGAILEFVKGSSLGAALAAVLMTACGASSASTVHSPAATPSEPATAASGPITCRLPVAGFAISPTKAQLESGVALGGRQGTGGFLDLPSGNFTTDKLSDTSYLAASGTWLPVSLQAVSPDQSSYVEGRAPQFSATPPTTTLYLVQVRSKAERKLFTAPQGDLAYVIAYTARGIYVETASSTGPGTIGTWLIDPSTGSAQAVRGAQAPAGAFQENFSAISGDFAWGTLITGSQSQLSFKLVRLSLTDGSVVDWYDAPGSFFVLGFDQGGHPIIGLVTGAGGSQSLQLISDRDRAEAILPKGGALLFGQGGSVTDRHGTWFGSVDGSIWLYSSAAGLQKMATVPPQPGGSTQPDDQHAWRSVAGPCV